jgi:GGDEF domain-containing protein
VASGKPDRTIAFNGPLSGPFFHGRGDSVGAMAQALDALTGLPGHHAMNAMLEGAGPGWLVFADIDAMVFALGVLGGERSDQVLRDVAHVMRDVCPPLALVARYGSDEFLVHLPAAVDAPSLAERVRAAVEARFEDERQTIRAGTGAAGLG